MTTDQRQQIPETMQRLVVRISPDSLSFSTSSRGEVTFESYALKSSISLAANLREALRNVPMLHESYQRVVVMTDSPMLIVPVSLFSEDHVDELYRYTYTGQEQRVVVHSVVPELNAVAIFSVQKDFRQVLIDRFPQVSFRPATSPVWYRFYQKSFTGNRAKLYGYCHDHRMDVFSFATNRFKFFNSYAVSNPDDALYYLLAVWKQLGMIPQEDELHLSGDLPEKETLLERTRQFVKRVYVSNPSGEFNRANVTSIEGMPYDLMLYYLKGK